MESKNLKTVLVTAKVLGIISKVVYICCIVGVVGCAVGISGLAICFYGFEESIPKIFDETSVDFNTALACCIAGFFASLAGVIASRLHFSYFKMVQKVGTPFTEESAISFRHLGILNVCIPICLSIISAVVFAICKADTTAFDFESVQGISGGIAMILLSFVLAYGAEIQDKKNQNKADN